MSEANILRPVLFAPPSMPALDLLVKMQATRTHMALVIDEYGGTDGLASIEDIVEMIVGDIEDEHDLDESPKSIASADGGFVVDARASLEDVSQAIDADLTAISDAEEVDTLGGLITTLAGHVPVRGEIIVEGGLEFEILDADPRRVKRIQDPPRRQGRAGKGRAGGRRASGGRRESALTDRPPRHVHSARRLDHRRRRLAPLPDRLRRRRRRGARHGASSTSGLRSPFR